MEVKISREIRDYTEAMFLEYSELINCGVQEGIG